MNSNRFKYISKEKHVINTVDDYFQMDIFKESLTAPEGIAVKKVTKNAFKYSPVVAESHTPPYKIHKYFARRPWNVFEQLVQNFSQENEIILDPFCGGGVTVYEGIRKGRKVIGCDINPLSIFVVRNMVKKNVLTQDFLFAIESLKKYVSFLNGSFTKFDINGSKHNIEWSEVTFKVRCSQCNEPTLLSNEYKIKNGSYSCMNKNCESHKSAKNSIDAKNCERIGFEYLYLVGKSVDGSKIVKQYTKADTTQHKNHVQFLKEQMIEEKIQLSEDLIPLDWDRQFEDGLSKKGIANFQDLFTERNLLILTLLLNKIKSFSKELSKDEYELLRLIFSNTVKDTNIMAFTNDTWQGGKPTTWSKHAYWIPSQFCEVSIIPSFEKSIQRILSAVKFNNNQSYKLNIADSANEFENANLLLINDSIAQAEIPENFVDAIITDPPYGSNVQYLELSHFWYVWNKDLYDVKPNFKIEAVSNRKKGFVGAKSMYDYEENLFRVFSKSYLILKPNRFMVLTFNNKDVSAWLGLLFSIFRSGFTLSKDGVFFQDGVKNYKQTAHTKADGSPYGDFIYSFKKAKPVHNLKKYKSEDEFAEDLENIFGQYLLMEGIDKNELLMEMFSIAIPLIEGFSKSYLMKNKHSLYTKFHKNYFNQLYKNVEN